MLQFENPTQEEINSSFTKFEDITQNHMGDLPIFNRYVDRYANILSYRQTNVTLKYGFINANFIDSINNNHAYIATQSPLYNTINDFWNMIIEHNINIIINLTNNNDEQRGKTTFYYEKVIYLDQSDDERAPNKPITPKEDYKIILSSTEEIKDKRFINITKRVFLIQYKNDIIRNVIHYHYNGWPDSGIPSQYNDLYYLNKLVIKTPNPNNYPIVVHCSAGIGRTGVFCAINMIIKYIYNQIQENNKNINVNIYDIVSHMREQRIMMVQTPEQYKFITLTIIDFCNRLKHIGDNINIIKNGKKYEIIKGDTHITIIF
jgi:protein tyrosine phosphatase